MYLPAVDNTDLAERLRVRIIDKRLGTSRFYLSVQDVNTPLNVQYIKNAPFPLSCPCFPPVRGQWPFFL